VRAEPGRANERTSFDEVGEDTGPLALFGIGAAMTSSFCTKSWFDYGSIA